MLKRPLLAALPALALLAAAPAAFAEAASSPLRDGFANLPEIVFEQKFPLLAYVVDPEALGRSGEAEKPQENARLRSLWHDDLRLMQAWIVSDAQSWKDKTGLEPGEFRFVAGFGQAPGQIAVMGLPEAADVEALLGRLDAGEFDPVEGVEGAEGALINGEPMAFAFDRRSLDDPWRGQIGQAVAVAGKDAALIYSPTPEPISFMLGFDRSLAENPISATALTGAEAAAAAAQGELLQAMLFSPALGLEGYDPSALMFSPNRGDPAALRAEIQAAMEAARFGLPPYFGGVFADAQIDGRPALVISLAYPDCETAAAAAEEAAQRWRAEFPEPAAEVSASHHEGAEGLCAAVVAGIGDPADQSLARAAYGKIMNRAFPLLRIGEPTP